jgi:hypothetical protein
MDEFSRWRKRYDKLNFEYKIQYSKIDCQSFFVSEKDDFLGECRRITVTGQQTMPLIGSEITPGAGFDGAAGIVGVGLHLFLILT